MVESTAVWFALTNLRCMCAVAWEKQTEENGRQQVVMLNCFWFATCIYWTTEEKQQLCVCVWLSLCVSLCVCMCHCLCVCVRVSGSVCLGVRLLVGVCRWVLYTRIKSRMCVEGSCWRSGQECKREETGGLALVLREIEGEWVRFHQKGRETEGHPVLLLSFRGSRVSGG